MITNIFKSWSLPIEKSEAIARARRGQSSWLTWLWTQKEYSEKMEDQGGGEAHGVADPHPPPTKKVGV
jgi:hypothetical protein